LKGVYNNSSDSEILIHLKKDLQNSSEDDPNSDHESRMGVPYTEEEDLFLKQCYEKRENNRAFTIREWMKKKVLKGRSYPSLKSRLQILSKMNWVTACKEKKSHSKAELTFNKNKWGKDVLEELKSQYDSKIITKNIKIQGRTASAINNKIEKIQKQLKRVPKELKTLQIVLENSRQKFQYLNSHFNVELFYVCVFPTTVVENYVAKLENKVRFFVSCHKIQTAKLCYDENNILIYLNDDDLRYKKREEIDKISLCEYDLSSCFKKVIAISQKRNNNNLYVHVMLFGYDNQINTFCNFYSELLTDSEFNSNKINVAFCEKELENIDLAVTRMLSKKPYTSVVDFSKTINQIRKMLNVTVLNDL
jgi:hypothetical protein